MEKSVQVKTNSIQGKYRPWFFDWSGFSLSEVTFNSLFFEGDDVESAILKGEYSFAYLREDKLRTIDAVDDEGEHIPFTSLAEKFGISIKSSNLFKTGKYFSRVFRPVKYGGFYKGLDVYVNREKHLTTKITDGISLVSLELAKSLGWKDVKENMSAQFTLFYNDGLVKGHCVVSNLINHDIVIYGEDNIKEEISFTKGVEYVALEPVKKSDSLRMDIQSLLNLWKMFGPMQYLEWADKGIQQFKKDLFSGNLSAWLDNFEDIDVEDYSQEQWTLRKAIWHRVDYTKYPGLVRSAWTMFKTSLMNYACNGSGEPNFRIPVPGGKRGYLRVDLRDHDKNGCFTSSLKEDEVEVDEFGNVWFSPDGLPDTLSILGGADLDDALNLMGIEAGQAVIYRNPNQYGEYIIRKIKFLFDNQSETNKLVGEVPQKQITEDNSSPEKHNSTGNSLLDNFLASRPDSEIHFKDYTAINLLRTFTAVSQSNASIGFASNGDMLLCSIGIVNPDLFTELSAKYKWNLENIIDATVKDGSDASDDMKQVSDFVNHIIEAGIPIPNALKARISEKKRESVVSAQNHPVDELLSAIKYLIQKADREVLGEGAASKGNRVPGLIDTLDIPVMKIGLSAIESPLYEMGITLMKDYNKAIAIMLDGTKNLEIAEAELKRKEGIEIIQTKLLSKLSRYTSEERSELAKVFAYETYKTNRAVHDSILWIGDKDDLRGTADDTIEMLSNLGLAMHVKSNGSVKRYKEISNTAPEISSIRLWSKEELSAEVFVDETELIVESGSVLLGASKLNLGQECEITDGIYKINDIINSRSRKDNNRLLRKSLTVYIA